MYQHVSVYTYIYIYTHADTCTSQCTRCPGSTAHLNPPPPLQNHMQDLKHENSKPCNTQSHFSCPTPPLSPVLEQRNPKPETLNPEPQTIKARNISVQHPHPTDKAFGSHTTDWHYGRGVPGHVAKHKCSVQVFQPMGSDDWRYGLGAP